jgi:hypothetical protein
MTSIRVRDICIYGMDIVEYSRNMLFYEYIFGMKGHMFYSEYTHKYNNRVYLKPTDITQTKI